MKVFMVVFRWQHDREYFKMLPPDAGRAVSAETRRAVANQCDHLRDRLASGTDADRLLSRAHLLMVVMVLFFVI